MPGSRTESGASPESGSNFASAAFSLEPDRRNGFQPATRSPRESWEFEEFELSLEEDFDRAMRETDRR